MKHPDYIHDDTLEYLDELRKSGSINMWGARRCLMAEFDMEEEDARQTLLYWMKTFEERYPSES